MIPNTWDTHNGYLADRRKAGATLEEIGKEVGVTRERVRQILKEHYGGVERGKPAGLLTTAELVQLTGLSANTINSYRRRGIIKPTNASIQYPLYNIDALKTISDYKQCHICGRPIPVGRYTYCSPECLEKGLYKSHARVQWRILRRKKGQPITPSVAYRGRCSV